MPIGITTRAAAGQDYGNPFVGPVDHTAAIRVDVSALTNTVVDANGYLKPGTPLQKAGTLLSATTGQSVYGVVVEAVKVAASNAAGDLTAGTDIDVAVATIAEVNQAIIEDNLGRALNANELAGFAAAGCHIVLA